MSLEADAYALLSWKRFDDEVTDELLRAVTSAFALIAVADGDLAKAEDDRFMSLLKDKSELFEPLDFTAVDQQFRSICGAMLSDPIAGRRLALNEISAVQSDAAHAELVRSAAEIAIAADSRGALKETAVLHEICAVLKLTPR